jgi:hypothetical protein
VSEIVTHIRAAIDRSADVKFFIGKAQSIPDTAATVNRPKMNLAAWHAGEVWRLLGEAVGAVPAETPMPAPTINEVVEKAREVARTEGRLP